MNIIFKLELLISDFMKNLAQYGKTIGLNFRTWLGPLPIIVMANPDDLKILYNHPQALNKSRLTKLCLRPLAGDSILLSDSKFAETVFIKLGDCYDVFLYF